PAIDRGNNAVLPPRGLATDQRGLARVVNGVVDIGAFENQVVVTAPAARESVPGKKALFALGSFTDGRTSAGPWSVTVHWGDGTPDSHFQAAAQGSLGSLPHTYTGTGPYTISVTVTDAPGEAGRAT